MRETTMNIFRPGSLRRTGIAILVVAASSMTAWPVAAQDPSSTPTGTGGPSASSSPAVLPTGGILDQASYYVDAGPDIAPARFSFSVPAGWVPVDGGVSNIAATEYPAPGWEAEAGFETWILSHVFTDACQHTTLVDAGSTVDELATALLAQQGVTASGPTDVTVAGHPAKRVELTVPVDLDLTTCVNGKIRFWPGPGPDMSSGMCCRFGPGTTVVVDVVDVDGHRWAIAARHGPATSVQDLAALDAVLASIQIDDPSPDSSPMSSAAP
jgi:hypothetical protein